MSATQTTNPVSRRTLHFNSIDEALGDVHALQAADRNGSLRKAGNWSLGQACGHVAAWVNYGFDGVPLKIPWFVKLIFRTQKKRFLRGPMPAGRSIPNVPGGTLATEPLSTAEGVARLEKAFARLKASSPGDRHPILGQMTHDQWIQGNLRHAELHLSFLRAD
jgi:hypothetical protein